MTRVQSKLIGIDVTTLKDLHSKTLDYIRLNSDDPSHTVLQVIAFAFGSEKCSLYCYLEVIDYFGLVEDISYFEFMSFKYPFVDFCNFVVEEVEKTITGIS